MSRPPAGIVTVRTSASPVNGAAAQLELRVRGL